MANDCPVVMVHGLFGWGPDEMAAFPYWGTGLSVPSPLPRHEASVGPVSSLHDRACELAFQIKGGRVDYGAEHAEAAGHERFGRTWPEQAALHPGWSATRPVHLVGHSMGGPTAFLLQQLLAEDAFGWGSSHRWVASVSSISGPLNGATATYFHGCDEETGLVDPGSVAGIVAHAVELYLRATGDLFDRFYDFDLDHWGLHPRPGERLDSYVGRIAASPLFAGSDNGLTSLTVQSLAEQNARCTTHADTWYFSHVTEQTVTGQLSGYAYPEPGMNPFLVPAALYTGRKRFARPLHEGFVSSEWWPNDGMVSVHSQAYPRSAGDHPVAGDLDATADPEPGGWYVQMLPGIDHVAIVALPRLDQIGRQKRFYRALYQRLHDLDVRR